MKRAFPHNKNKKHHGKKGGKRFHQDSNPTRPAAGEHRSGDCEDSDSDLERMDSEGLTGVIDKLGELNRGRPAGLVTFTLKNGESAVGKFSEEQTVANGFRLKDMRAYTSNPSLTFPFHKGMPFKIYGLRQMPKHVKNFSYVVHIIIGGSDGPGSPIVLEDLAGKDITSYDGESVTGTVKALKNCKNYNGVAEFVKDGSVPLLTHFSVQSASLNGLAVSPSRYVDMMYVGMALPMQITSSASTKIPGIYYTADVVLDIPAACGGEEALQEPEEFRGVVLKAENKTPVLFSLFCKGNEDSSRKFYVACEKVTANNEPVPDVGLDFSEGTSVLCSLRFKHKYPKIEEGCVYLADADMPIKMCEIKRLRNFRGISFPQLLVTTIDGGNKEVFVNRSGMKINGRMPSGFPEQFFKVNMVIPVNDIRVMNNNYRASLNVSTDIVNKNLKIEEGTSCTGGSAKKSAGGKRPRKPMPVQGVISGLRENSEGRVLPSEVSGLIEEKEQKINIPVSQVFVNGKTEMYLPTSMVFIGGKIKVHNVKFSEDSKSYEGTLVYDFPRAFMLELFGTNQKQA